MGLWIKLSLATLWTRVRFPWLPSVSISSRAYEVGKNGSRRRCLEFRDRVFHVEGTGTKKSGYFIEL